MLISIFASVGAQNLGDELILKNEISILKEQYKEKNPYFIVYTYDLDDIFFEDENVKYKKYFPIDIKNPTKIFKNIKNFFIFLKYTILSDLIIIGGGGLFFDNEVGNKKNPLDLWIFRMRFFTFLFKKIYFFRVGLSIKQENSFEKVKNIFSGKRKKIEVRDSYSQKVLQDLGIKNVIKNYDSVFWDNGGNIKDILNNKVSLKKVFKNFNLKDLENIDFRNKKVGIAFRSGYLSIDPELEVLLVKEIIEFIQKKGAKVLLLTHSFSKSDILSNDFKWMEYIQSKTKKVGITKNLKETYEVYKEKKVDIILAQRLHSIILSQVYGIPFVGISYSKKTEEILSELR